MRSTSNGAGPRTRTTWLESDVVNASSAAFAVRNYLEQTAVRRYVRMAAEVTALRCAADIGAGYGRLALVLQEACERVLAFEREPSLVERGRLLVPGTAFHQVASLDRLPAPTRTVDFALSFTVLQHLEDAELRPVIAEIQRLVRAGGFALLCEETDDQFVVGEPQGRYGHFTVGRSVADYEALMAPMTLVATSPRLIEAEYPRTNVGSYMLFRACE